MARFKNFQHGPHSTRHGEQVAHIRPMNWSQQILAAKHDQESSSPKSSASSIQELRAASEKQLENLDPVLSEKTSLLNNWSRLLKEVLPSILFYRPVKTQGTYLSYSRPAESPPAQRGTAPERAPGYRG